MDTITIVVSIYDKIKNAKEQHDNIINVMALIIIIARDIFFFGPLRAGFSLL